MKTWRGLTVVLPRAVPARVARRPGRTRRMGGRDGRAGDAPPDRASPAAGAWTRAVTSARLDQLHQVDGPPRRLAPQVASARLVPGDRDRHPRPPVSASNHRSTAAGAT